MFDLPLHLEFGLKFKNVTLHGKTGKKVMTQARYFNTLKKRKFF